MAERRPARGRPAFSPRWPSFRGRPQAERQSGCSQFSSLDARAFPNEARLNSAQREVFLNALSCSGTCTAPEREVPCPGPSGHRTPTGRPFPPSCCQSCWWPSSRAHRGCRSATGRGRRAGRCPRLDGDCRRLDGGDRCRPRRQPLQTPSARDPGPAGPHPAPPPDQQLLRDHCRQDVPRGEYHRGTRETTYG